MSVWRDVSQMSRNTRTNSNWHIIDYLIGYVVEYVVEHIID